MKVFFTRILITIPLIFSGTLLALDTPDPIEALENPENKFVFVPAGCFEMGDFLEDATHSAMPVHEVCLNGFYIGSFEVTVGDFKLFAHETGYKTEAEREDGCLSWMRTGWRKGVEITWKRPGFLQTDRHPVTCVSWQDVSEYLEWKRLKTGWVYRLPTEAEWEYAARGGVFPLKSSAHLKGMKFDQSAWYSINAGETTHPVGEKKANGLGLYDMSGNVWEWIQDRYSETYYASAEKHNPPGPETGKGRVMRGGSWYVSSAGLRPSHRNWTYEEKRYTSLGFRLVLEKP